MPAEPRTLAELDARIVTCRRCSRLVEWREQVAREKRASYAEDEYWGRPVPGFGVARPRLWIIGLAPAAHGANRTGRMFTGDRSGDWLFASLHRCGIAKQPTSVHAKDGQRIIGTRITAAVHCAPPDNKPTTQERLECGHWLHEEVRIVEPSVRAVLALGGIAWAAAQSVLRECGWSVPRERFGHGATCEALTPSGRSVTLVASYHPSQQNTFTGRLTEPMLDAVVAMARDAAGLGQRA